MRLLFLLLTLAATHAQGLIIDPYRFGSTITPPLDLVTNSSGAYSAARKLNSTYAGSALRVRRSSDDAESDIGFYSTNILDVVTLASFVGANDGFVTKLYDQSGNGRDLTNVTTTAQPRIVIGGVIQTNWTGKPWMVFDGSDDLLKTASFTGAGSLPTTTFTVFALSSFASGRCISSADANTDTGLNTITSTGNRIRWRSGVNLNGDVIVATTNYLATGQVVSGAADSIQVNNATAVSGDAGDNSPTLWRIGHDTLCPAMGLAEFITYNNPVPSGGEVSTLQNDINAFYTLW